jgi:hypothetical protein
MGEKSKNIPEPPSADFVIALRKGAKIGSVIV